MGLVSLSLPFLVRSVWPVLLLCGTFALLLGVTMALGHLRSIHGVERTSGGVIFYPIAVGLLFWLAADRPGFYVACILIMTICDTAAALVGGEYGRHTYRVHGNVKSIEGSLIFLLTAFVCAHLPLLLMTDIGRKEGVLVAVLIAILVTVFEALSGSGIDNIIVPYGTYFILVRAHDEPVEELVRQLIILLAVTLLIVLLTRLPGSLMGSAVLAVILVAYGAWALGDFSWFVPVMLVVGWFCVAWAIPRRAIELPQGFELREVFHVFVLPFGLLWAANAWQLHEELFLPFLAAITTASVLICHQWLGMAFPAQAASWRWRQLMVATTVGLGLVLAPSVAVHRQGGLLAFVLVALSSLVALALFVTVIDKRVKELRVLLRRLVLLEAVAMTLAYSARALLV
jgi:phytol kinase